MATDTLEVLNGSGHLSLSWDPENEQEVAQAREEVARLKAAGYQFFLVENEPADEVAAGHGALEVRRIVDPTALPPRTAYPVASEPEVVDQDDPEPAGHHNSREWRQWRDRQWAKGRSVNGQPPPADRRTVAVAPMRGG